MQVDAVIVAAGSSSRFGGDKLVSDLCGRPVIAHTLARYAATACIDRIVLVVAAGRIAEFGALADGTRDLHIVPGGTRRRDSVEAGLRACTSGYAAIHDGARPLTTSDLIARTVAAAEGLPGAIAAIPVTDTIKEVTNGRISGHPDRSRLWAAQTPQVVLRQAWFHAAASGDNDETDDAAMLSRLGLECVVVEGSPENIKITRPQDLVLAEAILRARGEA